tara:strand:- start:565 stop:855 length:291 start_codon:yes stop_codon:yes gene_type:complete
MTISEFFKKYRTSILAAVAIAILGWVALDRLNRIEDNMLDLLDRVSAVEVTANKIEETVTNISATQGTIRGNNGDNKLEIGLLKLRVESLERRLEN